MDNSFNIGTTEFKVRKLGIFPCFHVVRGFGPTLARLMKQVGASFSGKDFDKMSSEAQLELLAPLLEVFFEGLQKMPKKESEEFLTTLLTAVEMKQESGNWANVATENGIMFQNLDLPVLMVAAGRAFMFNAQNFFVTFQQMSQGGALKLPAK